MKQFVYIAETARIVFGAKALAHLEREIELLGVRKVLVLSTPGQAAGAQRIADRLGERAAAVYAKAAMHVPIETAREAGAMAQNLVADCLLAVGGGSTIGLAKAMALEHELPILAIPTTYAGSEMTPIYGITAAGVKVTGKDLRVLPHTVIYDPELTLTMPLGLSITSGMNAIAHAVEGLYAREENPIMSLVAEEGVRAMAAALPFLYMQPVDLEARSQALYGAWLCGMVLGNVGMALHHKLCHTLGGSFNLPHAEVHTVMLPQVVAFNAPAVPQAIAALSRALQSDEPATTLFDLALANGAPIALRDIGMHRRDLDLVSELAIENPYWNPRPFDREAVRELLQRAWEGVRPELQAT